MRRVPAQDDIVMAIAFEPPKLKIATGPSRRVAAPAGSEIERVKSSIVLVALAAVMLTQALMPSLPQAGWALFDGGSVVEPREVRIIDTAPRLDVPCEQQTWPYIHARCLSGGSAVPRIVSGTRAMPDLDPRNATPPVVVVPPARERIGPEYAADTPQTDAAPLAPRGAVVGTPPDTPKPRRNYFPKVTIQ
jgi:hypothetical protein